MASPNMFLSSPSRPPRALGSSPLTISSSPDLPPLKDIALPPSKVPAFQKGSTALAREQDAANGSTNAGASRQDSLNLLPVLKTPPKPRAPVSQHVIALDSDAPSSDPFETMKTPPPKKQPWKQFKPKTPMQPSAPGQDEATLSPAFAQASNGDSVHITEQDLGQNEIHAIQSAKILLAQRDEPLNLEHAPLRRKDWTPPSYKQAAISESATHKLASDHLEQSQDQTAQPFNKLLEAYKFAEGDMDGSAASEEDGNVFRKRKLIECVSVKAPSEPAEPEAAPVKRQAPKKKARTITALAMAAYKPATQPDPELQPAVAGPSKAEDGIAAKPTGGKATAKPRKRTAKAPKKKAAPPKPVLLSPSAAMRQVANQDFIFGTSSQLAGEHSPSFLRDLARALKKSNELDTIPHSTPVNSDSIEPPEQRQSLWNAAARDEDGDLFDVGVRELADGAAELPASKQTDPFGYVREAEGKEDSSFLNLSDILEQPLAEQNDAALPQLLKSPELICADSSPRADLSQKSQSAPGRPGPPGESGSCTAEGPPAVDVPAVARPKFELYTDAQLSREVASFGFKNIKSRNSQIALLDRCWQSKAQLGGNISSQRQASTLSSAKQPSKGKAAKKPSPTKTPVRPQSSWASSLEPQEPPPSAQPVEPPKRGRGRPRKTPAAATSAPTKRKAAQKASPAKSTAASAAPKTPKGRGRASKVVVEIPDSDSEAAAELSEVSPSPPCSDVDETFSPARVVDMSVSMDEDTEISISVSPSDQPASFSYIRKAITTAPRTKDPLQPSWHEKMLMYDPIVVEDLAAWLNGGELTRVGYDDEVSSGEVKKWCESKSICCLWKVNLRGKERKRF